MTKQTTFYLFLYLFLFTSVNIFSQAPVITKQPSNQGVIEGQTATFFVEVTGSSLSYQWYKNGSSIPGANNSIYTTPVTNLSDDGSLFSVKVSNGSGSDSSNSAKLYVTASDSRVTSNEIVEYDFKEGNGNIIHDISGVGSPVNLNIGNPNNVAWSPNGLKVISPVAIQSSLNPKKLIDSCTATNELTIELWVVPHDLIQDTANLITLQASLNYRRFSLIQYKAQITAKVRITPSTDLFGEPGVSTYNGSVKLSLTQIVYSRSSDGIVNIYFNGSIIRDDSLPGDFSDWGGTNYALALAGIYPGGNNWLGTYYYAGIYNRALSSSEINHNYNLGISADTRPFISKQPRNVYAIEESTASFSVIAVSTAPINYQWQKDGINIPGATSSTYTTNSLTLSDDNANSYRVIVSNSGGKDTSDVVKVTVEPKDKRISSGIQVLYDFQEKSGTIINDNSGTGSQLNLNISNVDSVEWKTYGLDLIGKASIISNSAATKIINSCTTSNEITIEAWIKPSSMNNGGSIVSCTVDQSNRNFLFSHLPTDQTYECRLRTSKTALNGTPFVKTAAGSVQDSLTHVVYTRDIDGNVNFYVNNKLSGSGYIGGDLSNWNSAYKLALGSEVNGQNNWKGLLNLVAVYNRALSTAEIGQNFSMGPIGSNLEAPTNLSAVAQHARMINLTWKDNSSSEEGFIVERETLGPIVLDYKAIDTVAANDTSYTDKNISDTTSYKYRVKAFNQLAESGYSNEVTIKSLLSIIPAPTNLKAIKDSPDTTVIKLSWNDNSSNELGFVIQRKTGDSASVNSFKNVDTVGSNITSFRDSTTNDTTKYTYRIYAYNIDTLSAFSNVATITTPLPVELTSFSANSSNNLIVLTWETATEINNAGFSVERSSDNKKFSEITFIKGKGTSTEKSVYSYTDKSALSGKYYYRLKQVDFDGTANYSRSIEVDLGLPKNYSLEQNYPNPFNPSSIIRFSLPLAASVIIKLYNTLGQEVETMLNRDLNAGVHEIVLNGSNLSSGVYFYRLEARGVDGSNYISTKRMILLK